MAGSLTDGTHRNVRIEQDLDGKEFLWVRCTTDLVKNTAYLIKFAATGWTSIDMINASTTNTLRGYVGYANETHASNTVARLQIGGYKATCITASTTSTVGHFIAWSTGTVKTTGATTMNKNCFGAYAATKAASTTHAVILFSRMVDNIA